MEIKVLYHDKEMDKLEFIGGHKSDWIDVRASKVKINGQSIPWRKGEKIFYNAGDVIKIDLGISIELPFGDEAHVVPRGSTFKNYGMILVNSTGIIDESYKGDGDIWFMTYYALQAGSIEQYDRIGQFRIFEKMTKRSDNFVSDLKIIEVATLGNEDRGGEGSTGNK